MKVKSKSYSLVNTVCCSSMLCHCLSPKKSIIYHHIKHQFPFTCEQVISNIAKVKTLLKEASVNMIIDKHLLDLERPLRWVTCVPRPRVSSLSTLGILNYCPTELFHSYGSEPAAKIFNQFWFAPLFVHINLIYFYLISKKKKSNCGRKRTWFQIK